MPKVKEFVTSKVPRDALRRAPAASSTGTSEADGNASVKRAGSSGETNGNGSAGPPAAPVLVTTNGGDVNMHESTGVGAAA